MILVAFAGPGQSRVGLAGGSTVLNWFMMALLAVGGEGQLGVSPLRSLSTRQAGLACPLAGGPPVPRAASRGSSARVLALFSPSEHA